ncbi:methyltransferase [bacterium D16-51]|nr:methyltransferase [bacterium D16-59]RKI56326.1 methyltransferase [bacterium D16-51]
MDKVIIFGATDTGKRIYKDIKDEMDVIAFVDEDSSKWGTSVYGISVKKPQEIVAMQFDYIYIGVLTYYKQVLALLKKLGGGIPAEKIVGRYVEIPTYARIECLKSIRKLLDEDGISNGAVAELGVYRGEFAREINKVFPDRKCYLFDTFEGFGTKDCEIEVEMGYAEQNREGYFSNTTERIVLDKMIYPEMCEIRKGIFPGSAVSLEEMFCFVNLDADLYAPTLAGLEYFYPRMVDGGIILVHDYFSEAFHGVKDAVKKYCGEFKIGYLPIGDTLSVAIRKR